MLISASPTECSSSSTYKIKIYLKAPQIISNYNIDGGLIILGSNSYMQISDS